MSHKTKGFASMSQAKRAEVASMGGKAAHEAGSAHVFTSEEARAAGRRSWVNRTPKPKKP